MDLGTWAKVKLAEASSLITGDGLKGLGDGVGLELFDGKETGLLVPGAGPPGENLDGTVPARTRRAGLCRTVSDGGTKSGNPS